MTTDATDTLKPVHNKMLVIVATANYDRWLDPGDQKAEGLAGLLRPFLADAMQAVAVRLRVNNPRIDDPKCIEPLAASAL